MKGDDLQNLPPALTQDLDEDHSTLALWTVLAWIGQGKRRIAAVTVGAALVAMAVGLLLPKTYTAQATFLAPGSQQQGGSAAALAALGSLGTLVGGAGSKSPDELYVALLKSDSVERALDERFGLSKRYDTPTHLALHRAMQETVRVSSDRKSGLIMVDVDDKDPQFAAALANAHATEITKVLARLAVSEAQLRRMFFERQLKETNEAVVKAEQELQEVQERSGVIVLDKQAESLISGAAQVRSQIAEREVQLKVLLTSATEQNPSVMRLNSELRALRSELARMEASDGGRAGSAVDMPVGKLPAAAVEYVRARRELKFQETLLEAMVRQYESAKLDESKEGPALQQVDVAFAPDHKSKPQVAVLMLVSALLGLVASTVWIVVPRYSAWSRAMNPQDALARDEAARAWRWRH
jgi:capsule polysaccharide export protein KpsE/RkpR